MTKAVLVLDVGKTHAKLSLIDQAGEVLALLARPNRTLLFEDRAALDAEGVEAWLTASVGELARLAEIEAIVPVAHGAAAALVEDDRLVAPVLDYEDEPPAEIAAAYAAERDPFEATASPRLPHGLNLGLQLYWQEQLYPDLWPGRAQALLWPQYWAWRLCGEHAAEVSSLGCHTDLWRPYDHAFSPLAQRRGWDRRLGALKAAGDILGTVRPEFVEAGLAADCAVYCGVHDSNASLHAARGFGEIAGAPFSLISTGTWFVAFQAGGAGPARLDGPRDVLANVDVAGRPVPSARFMGGREYAAVLGDDLGARASLADAERVIQSGLSTRPSFAAGGPFPNSRGAVIGGPASPADGAALACLHLALMTDASLDLIASEGPIVIEGRFAGDAVYPAALASLRPQTPVFICAAGDGVALGAARLWRPELKPERPLERVQPALNLAVYAERWRAAAG